MRRGIIVIAVLGLAACGADGEPVHPTRDATITLSDTGVSARTRFGVRQGPFSVSLGLSL